MAGRHGTLVGNAAVDGHKGTKKFTEPGEVVRHYAEVCLTRWGVNLQKKLDLSKAQLQGHLFKIKGDYNEYVVMRNSTYTFSTDTAGERTISLGSKGTNFTRVSGATFIPTEGLSKGHIPDSNYFADII